MGVLKTVDDAGLAFFLGADDVGGGMHGSHQIIARREERIGLDDVVDGGLEPLPHRDGAIGGSQSAPAHVLEEIAAPFGDDQAIDDDGVVVQ